MFRSIALFVLAAIAPAAPVRFRITLEPEASKQPIGGRMLVLMSDSSEDRTVLRAGWGRRTWVAAREVDAIRPGETIDFDPCDNVYPRPFAEAPAGTWQFMALLDTNHNYNYRELDGDVVSAVVRKESLDPADSGPIELRLAEWGRARPGLPESYAARPVELTSKLLTAFWGRPITMRAGVVLPRGYDDSGTRRYPAAYVIPGFGGDHDSSWETEQTELVWVFLEASFPTGHHEFADSVNNGPWGEALVTELIPYLEKRFRLRPSARFLTGHSSGGWSSLWLQVTYPDFFHGTWSTAPDPVDFRSFSGINVTPGSTDNVYRASDGSPRNLIRGTEVTFEEFGRAEQVLGEYGGQLASFEAVFSPRGEDGRPMRMFNRSTGELNPNTIAAWQKYNIRRKLAENWKALEPRLRGKIHVFCGDQDTFHLEEAASLLCDFLAGVRAGATCEIIPERDHMDLYRRHEKHYPEGLHRRIAAEMEARYRALRPRPKKKTAGSGLQ